MTDGTVTMSLAQVDQLRDEIKSKGVTIDSLKKEIEEVKADKRIVEVTKYKSVIATPTRVDYESINSIIVNYKTNTMGMSAFGDYHYDEHLKASLAKELYKRFSFDTYKPVQQDDISYRNFEDVKLELREVLDKEYNAEIGRLKAEEKDYIRKLEESRQKFENDLTSAKNDFYKREENLKNEIKIFILFFNIFFNFQLL